MTTVPEHSCTSDPAIVNLAELRSNVMGECPRFEEGTIFEPELARAMSVAFDEICASMNVASSDHCTRTEIAMMVIALARDGERDPHLLRDRVLCRTLQQK